ncbi:alpha/beta hydrolase [Humibacter antri]
MTTTDSTDTRATSAPEDRLLEGPHGPLRVRIYRPDSPAGPALLWLHGGGFSGGDLDMPEGDWVSRGLAARGILVVSLDYRLAPWPAERALPLGREIAPEGVHYPVPVDEAVFAYGWAVESGLSSGPWAIGGASAGANIAAGAALRMSHEGGPVPALAVLAYPTLLATQPVPDTELRAALDAAADPAARIFTPSWVGLMYQNYLGGPLDELPGDEVPVYAVPGAATAEQLASFPSTIMINSDTDELRVSGEVFAETLRRAGVEIDASTEPGTTHGHLNRPEEAAASASLERFSERILALASPVSREARAGG